MSKKLFGRLPRKRVGVVSLGLVVALAAGTALYSIYRTPTAASAGVARTVKVTRGTVQSSVSASGNLSTVSTAKENFVNGGTLSALNVSVGQKVTAGEVLASIDSSQQSAALQSAETSLAVAKRNFANAQTSLATLQRTLNNVKVTLATDESGGTVAQKNQNQSALDSAQQQLTNDQNQLTSDESLLSTDQSNLATAQSTLSSDQSLGCPASSSSPGSSGPSSGPVTASPGSAPSVSTNGATFVSATSAVLNATINPNGAATWYYFDYGTTASYGEASNVFSLPAGTSSSQVSVVISGLNPNTTYLFVIEATNAMGTAIGTGVTVTTAVTSCTVDTQTISSDQTKVTTDQNEITKDQSAITVQELSVQMAQSNLKGSPSTVTADKSALVQDQSALAQSKVGLLQDQGSIAQDQVSVDQAEKSLQETTLVALISGNVTSLSGSVGQVVSGGGSSVSSDTSSSSTSSSSTSTALVTIQGLRQLEVVASFAEADAIKIAVHQSATISMPSLANTEVRGVVTAIAPVSSVVNNVVTYPVTISLISPPASLIEGMTAQVSVIVQTATNVLELPSAAITTTGSVSTVKVQDAKGVTTTTPVTLGLVGSSFTQVTSGVSEGETIVEPTATVSAGTSSGSSIVGGGGLGGRFGGGLG